MTTVSISNARENLFPLVRQVNEDHIVVEIVARDDGNAVLMSAEDSSRCRRRSTRSPPAPIPSTSCAGWLIAIIACRFHYDDH